MRVIDIQRQARQLGRLRIGEFVEGEGMKRLNTWKLTSNDANTLKAAAKLYGGTPCKWDRGGELYQLVTNVVDLPITISRIAPPPSTSYELWGDYQGEFQCIRRCDGCHISEGAEAGVDCKCHIDPKERARIGKLKKGNAELADHGPQCLLTMRVWVELPELPDIGVWRYDTKSFFGASEMPTILDGLGDFAKIGMRLDATLSIEQRKVRKKVFPVVVCKIKESMKEIEALAGRHIQQARALRQGGYAPSLADEYNHTNAPLALESGQGDEHE